MRRISIFSILGGLIFSTIPDIPTVQAGICKVLIPPLSPNKDNIISFSGVVRGAFSVKVDFLRDYDAGHNIIFETNSSGSSFSYSFTYPGRFVSSGITKFRFFLSNDYILGKNQCLEFETEKIVPTNMALQSEYKTAYSTRSNVVEYSILKGTKKISEKFTFIDFQKEQTLSYFNTLNIDQISFKYACSDFDLIVNESYVYVQNVNGWFSNIGTPYGSFRKLLIETKKVEDAYRFSFVDTFYVNPLTNEMFSEYKEGTMQTKKVFFPKNGFKDFKTMQVSLNLKGVGLNESMVSQSFLYEVGRNYFGNCYDSEFCISAQETSSNFDYGEVEEK